MTPTIHLFKHSTDYEIYPAGKSIFKEGDIGDYMYVVQEGEVEIIHNGKVFETLSEGGILGEMALIDNSRRSASAVAKSDCKLVPVDVKKFTVLVQQTPYFALQVMQVMAHRIRRLSE
jgi:CRP/FNR family transcriptional regulator, cyclic AMP receptor protein